MIKNYKPKIVFKILVKCYVERDTKNALKENNALRTWFGDSIEIHEENFLTLEKIKASLPQEFQGEKSSKIEAIIDKLFGKKKSRSSSGESRNKYGFHGLKIKEL